MTRMMRMGLFVGAFVALASCGAIRDSGVGTRLIGLATGQDDQPAVPTNALVPPEEMRANPGKYIRVNVRNLGIFSTMVAVGQNGTRTTWIDQNNISIALENGLIVATRGLARDLMGADVSQSWVAIQNGGGTAQRRHDFITDQDGILTELLQCSIVSEGTEEIDLFETSAMTERFKEKCEGEGLTFTNIYWINQQGAVARSLQAVSPDAGYLQIDGL